MDDMYTFAETKRGESGHAERVFEGAFNGAEQFSGTTAIKKELMANGPLVISSFQAVNSFVGKEDGAFDPEATEGGERGLHSMVLLGWKLTRTGEVWLVRNSWGPGTWNTQIAFRQFGVDDNVIAPKRSMSQHVWQAGPAWPCVFSSNLTTETGHWETWTRMRTRCSREEIEKLLNILEIQPDHNGDRLLQDAIGRIVLRYPKDRPARSHRYKIITIALVSGTSAFHVHMDKLPEEQQTAIIKV